MERGTAALAAGNPKAAIAHFETAIELEPGRCEAYNDCGAALEALGRPTEAVAYYQRALTLAPDYADAHANLANALLTLERGDEALAHYETAVAARPDSAPIRYNFGTALQALGRHADALVQFERALAAAPDHAESHNNLGITLQSLDRHAEAMERYRKAIALKPRFADPYSNLGNLLMEMGALGAAETAFLAAIAIAPRRGSFYFNLANVHTFAAGDAHLDAMERMLADTGAPLQDLDLIALHFALAKAYDDLDLPERAMDHWVAGNALKRRATGYDESAALAQMERIRRVFTGALLARLGGHGDPSPKPVFVVGMPRSGTTLVEQILSCHPRVHGAGELYELEQIAQGIAGFPEGVAGLGGTDLCRLAARYLSRADFDHPGAARVTDKMPWNFRHVGLIHLMFPAARIVHVRRDPVATCLSCFSKLFSKNQEFSYDLGELGRYWSAYAALMEHWRAVLPGRVMIEIDYESLVDDLPGQARRIVAHCGLAWDDACLEFHRNGRPVRTASAVQVRRPLFRTSLDRWRRYRGLAGPLLAALVRS